MSKESRQDKLGLISMALLAIFVVATTFFTKTPHEEASLEPQLEQVVQQTESQETVANQLSENDQMTVNLVNELTVRLENQEKVDSMIQQELESGYYTAENPLVILDPYSQSPLTALICFTTEDPTRVDIHIEGEDEYTEVNHSFTEFTKEHIIPIYGLYPDKLNPVTISIFNENEEIVGENESEIQTEPVSDHYQNIIILAETFQEGYQEGINYLYNRKMAFDKNGSTRWYASDPAYLLYGDYNVKDDLFIFTKGSNHQGTVIFYVLDKLGKIHYTYYAPYGIHHDISPMANGNLLVTGSNLVGATIEDFIYEIDIMAGTTTNTLDMKYILQRTRPAWMAYGQQGFSTVADWLHMNSIEYDVKDSTIIISSNHQSAVVKLDWPSGGIHWIMGNHNDWNPRMQQYLLTPIGDDFEWHYNQHSAEILPDYDGNPDTIDILLFDNGSSRFFQDSDLLRQIENQEILEPELYSRLVHYRINEITMEVEQIWQYGKERGMELHSKSASDVDLLDNGNIYGMFQHDAINGVSPILSEVTKDSILIWEAELFANTAAGSLNEYRAERLPFYFDDDSYHDIYSTARNLIPEDIMEFVANYNNSQ